MVLGTVMLGAAALVGARMVALHLRGRRLPALLVAGHGALAGLGVILLTVGLVVRGGRPVLLVAYVTTLLVTALGVVLVAIDVSGGRPPWGAVATHAVGALLALGLLVIGLAR